MGAAAQNGGQMHGAGVVDDDVSAGAESVNEFVIDEAVDVGLCDSCGEWVSWCCDYTNWVGFGEEVREFGDVGELFGAPLRSDVDGDEWWDW
jgi:hypothetical protein